jgi:hypothetical protein
MTEIQVKNLESADEVRPFKAHGRAELATVGQLTMSRGTFEPGWRWTQDVGPIMQLERCPVHHQGIVLSGRMHIQYDDGSAVDLRGGDIIDLPEGHDAWVIGDEACVVLDVSPDTSRYAAPRS